jgi:hypothetical protein
MELPSGKSAPMQKITHIYHQPDADSLQLQVWGGGNYWINHFQTCPDAKQHSKKAKPDD